MAGTTDSVGLLPAPYDRWAGCAKAKGAIALGILPTAQVSFRA